MQVTKPVCLIGMMGAGKSSAGRIMAAELNVDFHDTDNLIGSREGRSVAQIFADAGEAHFRALEKAVLADLLGADQPAVIATGGGAVCDPDSLALIKDRALSVWLSADPGVLLSRLSGETAGRPLLQTADPALRLQDLLAQRQAFYAQADITVDTTALSAQDVARKTIKALYDLVKPANF